MDVSSTRKKRIRTHSSTTIIGFSTENATLPSQTKKNNPPVPLNNTKTAPKADQRIIGLELNIFGQTLNFQHKITTAQSRLCDMVPIAYKLSEKIAETTASLLSKNDYASPCKKGCSTCCHYLALLSPPEAFYLIENLKAMPPQLLRDIKLSSRTIASKVRTRMMTVNQRQKPAEKEKLNPDQQIDLATWYAQNRFPCPFMSCNYCSIYKLRPIVCRQHIVAGTTTPCSHTDNEQGWVVKVPAYISRSLKMLTSELENTIQEGIVLPCVFDWHRSNADRNRRTWSTETMVQRLFEIIKKINTEQMKPKE